jgi:hypothetical protein
MAFAFFHNAFQVMGFAHNPHGRVARKGTLGEHFREPLANFFEIAKHGVSSPAIGTGNKHQL